MQLVNQCTYSCVFPLCNSLALKNGIERKNIDAMYVHMLLK